MVALVPCIECRQVLGTLLLVARRADFELTEDVQRVCGRLGLDGAWLLTGSHESSHLHRRRATSENRPAFSPA